MKKLITGILMTVMMIVMASLASAHSNTPVKGGMYDYDTGKYYEMGKASKLRKVEYVGGGFWKHYMTASSVHSNYFHGKRKHSASVKNSK